MKLRSLPLLLGAATLVGATLSFSPAAAESGPRASICGERNAVVKRLEAEFGETRRGYGLQRGASVVEVFASEDSGSWTIIVTNPAGVSCLVAAGQNWAPTPEEASLRKGEKA
ncbi:MAG: hypothetical protein AAF192_10365 [Pseudomonadota bacterium]